MLYGSSDSLTFTAIRFMLIDRLKLGVVSKQTLNTIYTTYINTVI